MVNPAAEDELRRKPDDVMVIVNVSSGLSGAGDAVGVGAGGGGVALGAGDEAPPPHAHVAANSHASHALPVAQAFSPRVSAARPMATEPQWPGALWRCGTAAALRTGKKLSIAILMTSTAIHTRAQEAPPQAAWSWHTDASVFADDNSQKRRTGRRRCATTRPLVAPPPARGCG